MSNSSEKKVAPKEPTEANTGISLYDAVRTNPMYEHHIETDKSAFQNLWDMAAVVYAEGLEISHLVVGNKFEFQKWLKIQIPVIRMSFFGIPVKILPDLEADIFILCGAEKKDSEPDGIRFSVKGVIP